MVCVEIRVLLLQKLANSHSVALMQVWYWPDLPTHKTIIATFKTGGSVHRYQQTML